MVALLLFTDQFLVEYLVHIRDWLLHFREHLLEFPLELRKDLVRHGLLELRVNDLSHLVVCQRT